MNVNDIYQIWMCMHDDLNMSIDKRHLPHISLEVWNQKQRTSKITELRTQFHTANLTKLNFTCFIFIEVYHISMKDIIKGLFGAKRMRINKRSHVASHGRPRIFLFRFFCCAGFCSCNIDVHDVMVNIYHCLLGKHLVTRKTAMFTWKIHLEKQVSSQPWTWEEIGNCVVKECENRPNNGLFVDISLSYRWIWRL